MHLVSPHYRLTGLLLALQLTASISSPVFAAEADQLTLPDEFSLRILSEETPGARQMALGSNGTLFVGTWREGNVYAMANALTATPGKVVSIATGLTMPSGVTVNQGDLYVAALDRVLRFADIESNLIHDAPFTVVTATLPDKRHHGWKYIKFGPDGQLYVPVGAPCNLCESDDERFASILRMNPDDGTTTVYAHGVRNSVGFAWHPRTGQMWFSDNGRDLMGDDVPPEEINIVTQPGEHFGYPYVHAADLLDPEFETGADPDSYADPVFEIQAHSAALGMTFYTHDAFPPPYRGALFIAEHGSWNRSSKVGYRVSVITFGAESRYQPFVEGWLQGERDWGRPNDVLVTPAGSLLISDDKAGAIYEVRPRN
ncbi:MAG: PQQ-dependent sugar dehydrogenase [Pseudomonadales bacterium]|jgi:glucose/arabinose dehydrogenase|nr:PQQ-dependent sugar dehydrogenase [Pseudomonadales bacterium]MDP6471981.1 PQQ-dependent sugar dehydrogenase [Pseudomonadales bacterium]MDP6826748.1 PQQ-dependent sugar dehydrogenase [Pseudomonadales bacterium]MDP6971021.1 PQQ-dependent sugar dehydrogenase [Pseudomonadales bacterium]|tara:strand:- start:664 stop:1776 length:1113 start_codon:yes stop_codon:yes gene_type:complete